MGTLAAAGLGLLVLLLLGDTLLGWLRRGETIRLGERFALAFSLGAGGVSLLLFWGSLIFPGRVGAWCVLVPTALLVLVRGLQARTAPTPALPRFAGEGVCSGLCLLALVLLNAYAAIRNDLVSDALLVWCFKARIAFLEHGLPLDSLGDASRLWSHPDYPWLLPLDEAWIFFLAGEPRGALAKALCPGFFAALLLLFQEGAGKLVARPVALLGALALGLLPQVGYWAARGYADLPLSLFVLGSVLSLLSWLERRGARDLVLASILAGLAAWTKREGIVFVVFQGLAILFASRGRKPGEALRSLALFFGIVFAIAGPWLVLTLTKGLPGRDFEPFGISTLLERRERVGTILAMLAVELANARHWGLLWILFPVAVLLGRGERRRSVYLEAAALAPLLVLAGSYVLSAWVPFEDHVRTSLNRIVVQAAPLGLLFVVVRLEAPLMELRRAVRERLGCLSR